MLKPIGYLILFALLIGAVLPAACYAALVAVAGGTWSLAEVRNRRLGRPYVEPSTRFRMVWTRAMSPIDPKHWVTACTRPTTDPHLLPGQVTGDLRVESLAVARVAETGPLERFVISMRLHNHGSGAIHLDDLENVDLQLWTPAGKVVGRDAEWSTTTLEPDRSYEVDAAVKLIDDQPVASWAIAHRPQGGYLFFGTPATASQPT